MADLADLPHGWHNVSTMKSIVVRVFTPQELTNPEDETVSVLASGLLKLTISWFHLTYEILPTPDSWNITGVLCLCEHKERAQSSWSYCLNWCWKFKVPVLKIRWGIREMVRRVKGFYGATLTTGVRGPKPLLGEKERARRSWNPALLLRDQHSCWETRGGEQRVTHQAKEPASLGYAEQRKQGKKSRVSAQWEPAPKGCPPTPTCALWHFYSPNSHTFTHVHTHHQ